MLQNSVSTKIRNLDQLQTLTSDSFLLAKDVASGEAHSLITITKREINEA